MKTLLFFFFMLCTSVIHIFASAAFDKEEFMDAHSCCLESSKVDISIALQTMYGIIENDPKLKEFLFCMNKQNGIQDENGNFIKPTLKKKIENKLMTSRAIDNIVQKCAKEVSSPEESAFYFLKCLRGVTSSP